MKKKVALSIRGKEISYEYRMVQISEIGFYDKNPRIAAILSEHNRRVSDKIIDKGLWERDETHKLKRQIEKDGGLIHPIILYKGKVLEGNTRLCCYRHLYEETKEDRWRTIKCHVILDELSQEDIYRLLCTEHIAGKIDWDAYDKANLFWKMRREDGMTLKEMEAIVGESTTSIQNKIRAYELMVKHGIVQKDKYSHFEQLVMSGAVRAIKKTHDPEIEEKVIERIKDGTVRKATDIRCIGAIYKHKKARKRVFQHGEDVEQVYHDLKAKAPMTDSPIVREIESLVKRVQLLTRAERDAIKQNSRDRSKVEQLTKELLKLCREMGLKIQGPKSMRKG